MFFKGGCLCKLLYCTLRSTQFITSILQEARNECRQLAREQLVMVVMCQIRVSCSFVHFDIISTKMSRYNLNRMVPIQLLNPMSRYVHLAPHPLEGI